MSQCRHGELDRLARRIDAEGVTAAGEAQRAGRTLEQPFKHADALAAAIARQEQIAEKMQRRQQREPDTAGVADAAASAADAQRLASAGSGDNHAPNSEARSAGRESH